MAAAPEADSKQRQNLALVFGLAGELDQAAAIARIDLGEDAVRSNLAYYETLKAMPPVLRVRAIMGTRTQPSLPPRKPPYVATDDDTPAPEATSPAPAGAAPKPAPVKPSRTASMPPPKPVAAPVEVVKSEPAPNDDNGTVENADVTTHLIVAPQPTETESADDAPATSAEGPTTEEPAHSETAEPSQEDPSAEVPSPVAEPAHAPQPKPAG
jgi:hypothetical protein